MAVKMKPRLVALPTLQPRYLVAWLSKRGYSGYVVYDRLRGVVADGLYLTADDAQWAAQQQERRAGEAVGG